MAVEDRPPTERPRSLPATGILTVIFFGLTIIASKINDLLAAYLGLVTFWGGIAWLCGHFGWYSAIRARKWFLVIIALSIFGSTIVLPRILKKSVPTAELIIPIEDTITLSDLYPSEWGYFDRKLLALPNEFQIKTKFREEPYRFNPVVGHGKPEDTLVGIELYIDISEDVSVKESAVWRPFESGTIGYKRYGASIPRVPFGTVKGAEESLFLTFKYSGRYSIFWHVRGEARTRGLASVDGLFEILLIK